MKRLIVTADDFGLAVPVNEAVEQGHLGGILSAASLMVTGDAADDAVARARRLPRLAVGLHLVLVDGKPCLPPERDSRSRRKRRPVRRQRHPHRHRDLLPPRGAPPGRGGNPRPARSVPAHGPEARPCRCASSFPHASGHTRRAAAARAGIRHRRDPGAARAAASGVARDRRPAGQRGFSPGSCRRAARGT